MEEYKLENYRRDHPGKPLQLRSLNDQDIDWMISYIFQMIGVDMSEKSNELIFSILTKVLSRKIYYDKDISTDLLKELVGFDQENGESICMLFWSLEVGADLLSVTELLQNWDYLWYPTSDEAAILLIPANHRILLVTDHGYVGMISTNPTGKPVVKAAYH